jgi:hypothetical protein
MMIQLSKIAQSIVAGGVIFFFLFFLVTSYWAEDFHPEKKYIIGFLLSVLFTFWFFVFGFLFLIVLNLLFG